MASCKGTGTNCKGTVGHGMSSYRGTGCRGTHSHSMSNKGTCMWFASNPTQHSEKPFDFFSVSTPPVQIRFQQFLIFSAIALIHLPLLLSYWVHQPSFRHRLIFSFLWPPAPHFLIDYTSHLIIFFSYLFALRPIELLFPFHRPLFCDSPELC